MLGPEQGAMSPPQRAEAHGNLLYRAAVPLRSKDGLIELRGAQRFAEWRRRDPGRHTESVSRRVDRH